MKGGFGWRHGEDEPPLSHVDIAKSKNVVEQGAVCLRIFAVEEDVRSDNHAAEYTPDGRTTV